MKCRYCGAEKKAEIGWYDEEYCSGKCRKLDGKELLPVVESEEKPKRRATFEDYRKRPKFYRRRYQPERLNWGEPLTEKQLKQAGFRANREPIPGDWDYEEIKEPIEQKYSK